MTVAPAPPADSPFAERLRGFGPVGVVALFAILAANLLSALLSAALGLLWAWWSRTPWREIGYSRPRSWMRTVALGIPAGVAFKLLMKAVVMPLFGAPPINAAYHYLAKNRAALPGMILAVIIGAGFAEETFYRGYLFERLGKLLGTDVGAKISAVLLTAALFASAHYHDQGVAGVEQATITGTVFGAIFAVTGQIWLPMIAHAAFDLTAVAIIYWDLEAAVAHFVFR